MERADVADHERPVWDAAYSKGYRDGNDSLAEALQVKPRNSDERRAFIRQSAIQIGARRAAVKLPETQEDAELECELAWQFARALWACKPEDC